MGVASAEGRDDGAAKRRGSEESGDKRERGSRRQERRERERRMWMRERELGLEPFFSGWIEWPEVEQGGCYIYIGYL